MTKLALHVAVRFVISRALLAPLCLAATLAQGATAELAAVGSPPPAPTLETAAAAATTPREYFERLAADHWVERTVSLAELGISTPLVLGAPDNQREIYLPVPPGVAIDQAELHLKASYLRAEGGRTTLVVSLDGYPVSARAMPLEQGDASLVTGVDGAPRRSGYVRLGLLWGSAMGAEWLCTDARTIGNLLRVQPDSTLRYRYEAAAVRDLATAWAALPARPVLLLSANNVTTAAYESAWRMGLALEQAGKRSRVVVLPAVGETVALGEFLLAPGLAALPAFAALRSSSSHVVTNAAEVGALLALGGRGPLEADLVIADAALAAGINAALDALRGQIATSAPEAEAAFTSWRAKRFGALMRPLEAKQVALATAPGRTTIALAPDAGAAAAALFTSHWKTLAVSPLLVVGAASEPLQKEDAVSLAYLGGRPGSFEVLSHTDWTASFDIGQAASDGRMPGAVVLDIAAAPSAAKTPPVVSVFMNDILLGAKQMQATGERERLTSSIPSYALAGRNTLRVAFVRQLASDRCRETPEAYPVSVLPSSHVTLQKVTPGDNFGGMAARFGRGAEVLVPAAYLAVSRDSLPRLIRLSATTGVSPVRSDFTVVNGSTQAAPKQTFLALELPFEKTPSRLTVDATSLRMTNREDAPLLDLKGIPQAGLLEVVEVDGEHGITYRTLGESPPLLDAPLLLSTGNVAVLGQGRLLSEAHTEDPSGRQQSDLQRRPWPLSLGTWWMLPLLAVVFMVALLVMASRTRRRSKNLNTL